MILYSTIYEARIHYKDENPNRMWTTPPLPQREFFPTGRKIDNFIDKGKFAYPVDYIEIYSHKSLLPDTSVDILNKTPFHKMHVGYISNKTVDDLWKAVEWYIWDERYNLPEGSSQDTRRYELEKLFKAPGLMIDVFSKGELHALAYIALGGDYTVANNSSSFWIDKAPMLVRTIRGI